MQREKKTCFGSIASSIALWGYSMNFLKSILPKDTWPWNVCFSRESPWISFSGNTLWEIKLHEQMLFRQITLTCAPFWALIPAFVSSGVFGGLIEIFRKRARQPTSSCYSGMRTTLVNVPVFMCSCPPSQSRRTQPQLCSQDGSWRRSDTEVSKSETVSGRAKLLQSICLELRSQNIVPNSQTAPVLSGQVHLDPVVCLTKPRKSGTVGVCLHKISHSTHTWCGYKAPHENMISKPGDRNPWHDVSSGTVKDTSQAVFLYFTLAPWELIANSY